MFKDLVLGLRFAIQGVAMAVKNPKLLGLGLVRLVLTAAIAILGIGLALTYHHQVMALVWPRPDSAWIIWLWYLASWVLALLGAALASVLGYLLAQILFSIFIMDLMSRITEQYAGRAAVESRLSFWGYFRHLVIQEIPRTILPVVISLLIMAAGWLTFLAPVVTVVMPLTAGAFLAWENTDLVPARRMLPFAYRWSFFRRHFWSHVGFGLLFLVPLANIVFLSFAPVGGTLLYLEHEERENR